MKRVRRVEYKETTVFDAQEMDQPPHVGLVLTITAPDESAVQRMYRVIIDTFQGTDPGGDKVWYAVEADFYFRTSSRARPASMTLLVGLSASDDVMDAIDIGYEEEGGSEDEVDLWTAWDLEEETLLRRIKREVSEVVRDQGFTWVKG